MRLAALVIALACCSGCGGVLVVEDRAPAPPPPPPRVVVVERHECDRDEAVDIAFHAAARRHGPALRLVEVRLEGRHWRVDLCGPAGRGYETQVRVKVDRRTGDVVSYKSKTRHVHGHGHDRDRDGT